MITDTYSAMLAMQDYLAGAITREMLARRVGREEAREMARILRREMVRASIDEPRPPAYTE